MKARLVDGGEFPRTCDSSNSDASFSPLSRWRGVTLSLVILALLAWIPSSAPSQIAYQRLIELGTNSPTGYDPYASLIEGPDGVLYGTTVDGPGVYRINKDGTGFRGIVQSVRSYADVALGPDGALYGTGFGIGPGVFRVNRDGTGFRSLVAMLPGTSDSHLVLAGNGAFYGTSGAQGTPRIFRVNADGTGFTVIRQLGVSTDDGFDIRAGLCLGSDGTLYGVTFAGGLPFETGDASSAGTIFRIDQDGGGYSILHRFEGTTAGDGANPHARLMEASDGALYGTTRYGGTGNGTIFRINKDGGDYQVVHRLNPSQDGASGLFYSHLVEGTNGALYGTTFGPLLPTVFKVNKDGSSFTVLHQFGATPNDGQTPHSGVYKASDDRFYGTTWYGGVYGQGTVYRINHDGSSYEVLASFLPPTPRQAPRAPVLRSSDGRLFCTSEDTGSTNFGSLFRTECDGSDFRLLHQFAIATNDGRIPNTVLEASDGLLYGTTQSGGTNNGGVIFCVDRDGTNYVVLRRFTTGDGLSPRGGLIEGSDGWLYGTANVGGSSSRGTVFKLSKNGSGYVVLWNFLGGTADGGAPQGELLEGTNGVLYGTTRLFGSASRGTIYCIHPNDSGHDILHHFAGGDDGQNPMAGLLLASDGALYGTTSGGNTSGGTVFALNHDGGGYRVLRTFGFGTTGTEPRNLRGRLVEGLDGLLYGTTYQGGSNGFGTVFALAKDGTGFRVIWHLGADAIDGRSPVAGLIVGPGGVLYGNTEAGGGQNLGTFFRLDPRDVSLSIATEGANARVHWPVTGTADALEESSAWSGGKPSWSAAGAMVSSNAANYEATLPLSGTNRFLRVRREWR